MHDVLFIPVPPDFNNILVDDFSLSTVSHVICYSLKGDYGDVLPNLRMHVCIAYTSTTHADNASRQGTIIVLTGRAWLVVEYRARI